MSTIAPIPEHRIVALMGEQATKLLQDEAIERAKLTCVALRGVVIASDFEASRVADQLGHVMDGKRVAKAQLDGLTSPLRKAEEKARYTFAPVFEQFAEAERSGKNAIMAWSNEKERQRRLERERLEREAREAAAKQKAESGIEAPPMVAPPQVIPRPPQGRRTSTFETTVVCVEVVDPIEAITFDSSLFKLDETRAKAVYREAEGAALPPHPLGGFTLHGMRFWREKRIGVR